MLRTAFGRTGASTIRGRPMVTRNVRLASYTAEKLKPKDAPAIKAEHKPTKHTTAPPEPEFNESGRESTVTLVIRVVKCLTVSFLAFHVFTEHFYLMSDAYGVSMLPNMNSSGDYVLISKYYRRGRGIEVGNLVSFKHPTREEEFAVKRVLGREGDFVLMNTPEKSDTMIQVPEGHCWVVGDNLPHSRDSRMFGPLPMALIAGKPILRIETRSSGWLPRFFMIDQGLQDGDEDENTVD